MKVIYAYKVWKLTKGILPFCLFTFLPLTATAQKIVATQTTVNVGKVAYEKPVTAVFELRNKSHRKLHISEVKPDCYCTKVDYPKGDINANEKFQIRMTYNARQLGHFNQQAAIFSNASKKPIYITMKGVVLDEWKDYSQTYPYNMNDLLLDKNELEFDNIQRGDMLTQEIHLFNNSKRVFRPNLMHLPSYLTATVTPERLAPGRAGTIKVTINSNLLHNYGLTQSTIYMASNPGDKVSKDHEIGVSAILLPSFAGITDAQRQYTPKIQLSKETVNIRFDGKKKKKEVIEIVNQGRSTLEISSLQLFTGGLELSLGKSSIKPGGKTQLKITALRDDLMKVRTRPRILMITNDPSKPKVTISINTQ